MKVCNNDIVDVKRPKITLDNIGDSKENQALDLTVKEKKPIQGNSNAQSQNENDAESDAVDLVVQNTTKKAKGIRKSPRLLNKTDNETFIGRKKTGEVVVKQEDLDVEAKKKRLCAFVKNCLQQSKNCFNMLNQSMVETVFYVRNVWIRKQKLIMTCGLFAHPA